MHAHVHVHNMSLGFQYTWHIVNYEEKHDLQGCQGMAIAIVKADHSNLRPDSKGLNKLSYPNPFTLVWLQLQ